jgi:hypothetical protein
MDNELVEKEAVPDVSVVVPRRVDPSKKKTCPPGNPAGAVTEAVKVTEAPKGAGLRGELRVVVVEATPTLTAMGGEDTEAPSAADPL